MSGVRIKICGINDPAAFETAIDAGADWIGFVFFPPSPRYVTPEAAAGLSARYLQGAQSQDARSQGLLRVGLFVDPTEDDIAAALESVTLDALQLYGKLDNLAGLRARFGLPIWRAVGIRQAGDLPTGMQGADVLVLEAKPPPAATRPGGNATTFDWSLLRGWQAPGPWILAGGLTPDNVAAAIEQTGATAVDVSSGVEKASGLKDPALIRGFIQNARPSLQAHPPL